jgi:hypothetical protein
MQKLSGVVPLMKSLVLTSGGFGFKPEFTTRLAQSRALIWEVSIRIPHSATFFGSIAFLRLEGRLLEP